MLQHASTIITVGLWLSVAAFLLVAGTIWSVWRRESLPEVAYGGVSLTQRRLRWLWTAWLVGATLLGAGNDPVVRSSVDMSDPDAEAAASVGSPSRRTASTSVPLPFYRFEKETVTVGGVPVSSHEMRGFVLPSELIWALLAYLFLVIRFDPDSKWTRRFLHGRRRRGQPENGST